MFETKERAAAAPAAAAATADGARSAPSTRAPRPKRAQVSFSQEVLAKDDRGDGSRVAVEEEHGVFLGPLLGRMVVSASSSADGETVASDGGSSWGILTASSDGSRSLGDAGVEYDNLVVRMGLLKSGMRYRVVVPVPQYWEEARAADGGDDRGMEVRIAEESLDGDLRGEVRAADADGDAASPSAPACRRHEVCLTLSARRRGPYRGRCVLELTRRDGPEARAPATAAEGETPPPQRCLMSLQVDAAIMGKDMGTPKLRNDVICLGKMVGYDSDDETEWQGFD